jgi:hypothetical protein
LKQRKVLIITSSGGGGLLRAAVAKEQQELDRDPSVCIVKRDVVKDWYGKRVGAFSIRQWDSAQRSGNVKKLTWLFGWQRFADIIFWPRLFYCALTTLFREDVDAVIDTQPLGTSAILYAIRIFNHLRKKDLVLEKIAVDLPTRSNVHFLRPIKRLSKQNRSRLRLVTIPPLTQEGESEEEFWQKQCRLSVQEVHYEYVIRRAFFVWKGVQRERRPFLISLLIGNAEEGALIAQAMARGRLKAEPRQETIEVLIPPEDRVVTILLGSQPANLATLNYVKGFMHWARRDGGPMTLFAFCTQHRAGEASLFAQMAELLIKEPDYPRHFTVVPFSVQNDEEIARLFHRSDLTCTRSGGQTAMELMCVMKGEIWIHSETEGHNPSREALLKGIPGWEAGNALYLVKHAGAKIMTPAMMVNYS